KKREEARLGFNDETFRSLGINKVCRPALTSFWTDFNTKLAVFRVCDIKAHSVVLTNSLT
ncbi:hypothetical protein AMECASPLE_029251, partial [Ameca splendens]